MKISQNLEKKRYTDGDFLPLHIQLMVRKMINLEIGVEIEKDKSISKHLKTVEKDFDQFWSLAETKT